MTLIWAHARSEKITASNTLEAFEAAIEDGADGLEFDVHQSSDGVLVCAHDGTLEGPGGEKKVIAETSYADLRKLDVGDASTGVARIPRLDEVFELFAPTDRLLNVELKNLPPVYPGYARNVLQHIAASGMAERIVISSFDHRLLREIQQLDASIQVAALYPDGMLEPWTYLKAVGIPQAHPHFTQLLEPGGEVFRYQQVGIPVRAWTVDDPQVWRDLIAQGIDGIITNSPASAVKVRDESTHFGR
ncbi:glycerophosphodiester phosphodiesterase family protein [Propionimicrobium sp. PCR01-08-3]|uniref:glycerophosphodiester phosphodiesterase n=1 Tax=Propionimicrobium sp. PCR01-08-3 TaxID=3052086 RepID=UPI00255C7853|nr:glycerophosphodiester phosphodiesterase family protein [Propionimicrobium sp. PCR01-08-3]WIY82015.1 glycerophosphodiester phosphodiesterase family protein [Propionimicrobium sp. PCR01-08-3]